MRVFFYHTENIGYIYGKWQKGMFPGHFIYGATHLIEYGINLVMYRHGSKGGYSRLLRNINTLRQLLLCGGNVDAVYATHYTGIELIILLRALHLYQRPVIIWQHQPIVKSKGRIRDIFSRLFYRGIDGMFFFSEKMLNDSAATHKYPVEHMYIAHWGADLDFYDRVMHDNPCERRCGFISTGRERRDFPTLIKAFNEVNENTENCADYMLNLYLTRSNLGTDYEALLRGMCLNSNIKVHFTQGLIPNELSILVNKAACMVICCCETNYTVGLTTVVEALALGIPIICSRNPQMPIDIEKECCGITVPYYDVHGWVVAIEYIATHPAEAKAMGQRGRALAERAFNDRQCANDVAQVIKDIVFCRRFSNEQ